MKTAEAMEKMRRIEGRVSTDQVNRINVQIQSIVGSNFEDDHYVKLHIIL